MTSAAKVLQFPLAGIAKDQDYRKAYVPSEGVAFATPFAVNVMGECALKERTRGGSRPGLMDFTGPQPTVVTTANWTWPNGDRLAWATDSRIVYTHSPAAIAPDGSAMYDPHATFDVKAAKGSVPTSVTAMAKYRARLVVAGGTVWYASRQGDETDFDYGGDGADVGRAVAGNVALADRAGETITAIAALEDQVLVVATKRQMRILNGEPTAGEWKTVSEYTGIVSRDAWCWDSQTLWFVGENGLYAVVPTEGVARKVSGRLPEDFKGIETATLVHDSERNGIWIFAARNGAATGETSDWFYDIGNQAFWRMSFAATRRPTAGVLTMIGGVNRVTFLCADGTWRYLSDATKTDGGTAFASTVAIGPLRASGRDDMDGMLTEVSATIAECSDSVSCEVYSAHTPEAAVAKAEAGTGASFTWTATAGWNRVVRPRARGAWVIFKLSSNGRWGYESMTAVCKMFGRLRQ